MLRSFITAAAVLATTAFAQTKTDCNPLNATCPVDPALGVSNYTWIAAKQSSPDWFMWNNTGGVPIGFDNSALKFTIKDATSAPTLRSSFYYFFGTVSVVMKASPGTGVISAITSLSDDLDEIDWEFKGGNTSHAFTNFYGKYVDGMEGNGTDVGLNFDPTADFHNYTTVWTNSSIQWIVDGRMVRELKSDDPATKGGSHYPQTPMRVLLGSWSGGAPSQNLGTQQWAGGKTDYTKGPFDLYISSVYISDASSGSKYEYSDRSGSASSIKITPGNSTFAQHLKETAPGKTVNERFNELPSGTKIGIAVAAISVAAIAVLVMTICCIKQRRAGRKEAAIADAEFQKQEAELMAYRMNQAHRPGQMPGFGYSEFKGRH